MGTYYNGHCYYEKIGIYKEMEKSSVSYIILSVTGFSLSTRKVRVPIFKSRSFQIFKLLDYAADWREGGSCESLVGKEGAKWGI